MFKQAVLSRDYLGGSELKFTRTLSFLEAGSVAAPSDEISWYQAAEKIRPYVVRIMSPYGSGTGFLFGYSGGDPQLCGIATAAHVVSDAHMWEAPIRVSHVVSGNSALYRPGDRAITLSTELDSAVLLVNRENIPFPTEVPPLAPKGKWAKAGVEVGWVGFPGVTVASGRLCFFNGMVSEWIGERETYLIDGVIINGVSGAPAFVIVGKEINVIGIVSAYVPNRITGETLPGVGLVRRASQLQEWIEASKSLEEARKGQTPAAEAQESAPVPPPRESMKAEDLPSLGKGPGRLQ